MSNKDSLGDRMKKYELAARSALPIRMPVILRVDGKAFHTYTRGCAKPFDTLLMEAMNQVALTLCEEIQGAQLAYIQSDEISILVHNYKHFDSDSWFDNQIQKMVSVSAGIASGVMTEQSPKVFGKIKRACFDSRVFVLPEAEVNNYFLWRQNDWTRNSLQMLCRAYFSHKELHGKDQADMHEMLHQKHINWADLDAQYRRGRCVNRTDKFSFVYLDEQQEIKIPSSSRSKWSIDNSIPIFSQDVTYIENLLVKEQG